MASAGGRIYFFPTSSLNSICAELSSLISVSLKRYGLLRPLNLVEVAVYVLLAHVVEGAYNGPLEERHLRQVNNHELCT
jgi:hypothetical protein